MQRSKTSSTSSTSASTALRRTLLTEREQRDHFSDEDDLADPRPWETRAPLKLYGSSRDVHPTHPALDNPERRGGADLPLYDVMETRRRYGDKEGSGDVLEEKELLDDQGKWGKGHGAGPGVGGRRGLPPRQRLGGWVSSELQKDELTRSGD